MQSQKNASQDEGKAERLAEQSRLNAELRSQAERFERLQKQFERGQQRERQLEDLLHQTEEQNRALHRKLRDHYQKFMLPNADSDSSAGKLDGSRLFARADFSLPALDALQKIKTTASRADAFQEHSLLARPRRSSIDCLMPADSETGPMGEPNRVKPALKRQIASNMRNVDKLQNEVQDLRLNNAYLEK